jgi:serine/threonine-protein kinase
MRTTRDRIIAGRYVLGDVLGAGGMGVVYRAVDLEHGHDVALKVLHPRHRSNPIATQRFAAEADAGTCVRHPNVVAVLDHGASADGAPFLVMELLRGKLLDKLVAQGGELPLRRVAAIVGQLLAGLQALHRAGFVHGDVKAGNILVEPAGAGDAVKLIDLGLARAWDSVDAATARIASGTPEYMAPEVIRGEGARSQSDLYAAGVVLYQLLTGTTPFEGRTSREILRRHLGDAVVPPSLRCPDRGMPRALESVVMRALAKDPAARHPSAAAFAEALAAATPIVEPPARPGTVPTVFSASTPTKPWTPQMLPRPRRISRGTRGQAAAGRSRDTAALAELTGKPTHPQLASARTSLRSGRPRRPSPGAPTAR